MSLTNRRREILAMLVVGESNKRIALALGISLNTVMQHMQDMFRLTGARNRTHLAALAAREGWA